MTGVDVDAIDAVGNNETPITDVAVIGAMRMDVPGRSTFERTMAARKCSVVLLDDNMLLIHLVLLLFISD